MSLLRLSRSRGNHRGCMFLLRIAKHLSKYYKPSQDWYYPDYQVTSFLKVPVSFSCQNPFLQDCYLNMESQTSAPQVVALFLPSMWSISSTPTSFLRLFSSAFIDFSLAFRCLKHTQKSPAAMIIAMQRPVYIHTNFGSLAIGASAIPSADPNADCRRKMDMTNDFMDGGALVKAYSSPVTLAKISDTAMKKYAGVCTAT